MKKSIAVAISTVLCITPCSAYAASVTPTDIQALMSEENMAEVSFTEEEFINSLEEQGFTVEKVNIPMPSEAVKKLKQLYSTSAVQSTEYYVRKNVSAPAAPAGPGYVPAYHTLITSYTVVQGFRYFVSIRPFGIEMKPGYSKYTVANQGAHEQHITLGGQGVSYSTTVQFSYSDSYSVSVNAGWFAGSGATTYTYYYEAYTENSSFNWPLVS